MPEEFSITAADGGAVHVRIPVHDAAELRRVLARFVEALERGLLGRGRLAWAGSTDPLFPSAYPDRRRSREFRLARAEDGRRRLIAAADRIDRQLATAVDFTLTPDGVADWFMVCAHAQSLFVTRRWENKPMKRTFSKNGMVWLTSVQEAIADAALGHPSPWGSPRQ